MTPSRVRVSKPVGPWWLILCLVGLDYFSTLAYLPSLVIQAVGAVAPVAALIVALATLCIALPIYCYVIARSPDGSGATGLLERLTPGWRGKLLVLLLLSFVATDYVVTQNLSIADAAEHLRSNGLFQKYAEPQLEGALQIGTWFEHPLWQRLTARLNSQLVVTLGLMCASFASWAFWRSVSPKCFLYTAAVVVVGYMVLNATVIVSCLIDLAGPGRGLLEHWRVQLYQEAGFHSRATLDGRMACWLLWHGLVAFPFVALGLSGFELSMVVAPMVDCGTRDPASTQQLRIRRMRLLLITAAALMAIWLPSAVFVSTVYIPTSALHTGGPAMHRAIAYLAHGEELADGRSGHVVNMLFGASFGTLYDGFAIAILCLAGGCVIIALREYVPDYLQRLGMELEIARRLGVKMRFFNMIVLLVGIWFGASIIRMQWAYVTSVLALLTGASLAAVLAIRHEGRRVWYKLPFALAAMTLLLEMAVLSAAISASGLEIALAFALGIMLTSAFSRWVRSTELRWQGCDFVDEQSRENWERCRNYEFQILVPHRPGQRSRVEKEQSIRKQHRLDPSTPVILIEVDVADPSEFYQRPQLRVLREDDIDVIEVSRCASISHVLAALALEMSRVGRPAELHCGWSDEPPVSANLNFLLFGAGNIPWMVRELIRKSESDPNRRPVIMLG